MSSETERRKYTRINTGHVVSVASVGTSDHLAVGKDLSAGGIRFQTVGCDVAMGEVLRVTFNVANHTVVAIGRVAWATDIDPITLDVGLEFVDIDPLALKMIEESAAAAETKA